MLLHGDGTNGAQNNTFLDSSTNNFTITRSGNTTQGSFSPYGSNWSNFFNGSTSFMTAPASSSFIFTGDYTIEAWIYITGFPDNGGIFSTWTGGGGSLTTSFQFNYETTGVLYCADQATGAGVITLNNWIHVAASRSGTTQKIFVNGVVQSTATVSGTASQASTVYIGKRLDNNNYVQGYISNLRVVNGTAVYTSNFTPSTAPLTAITNTVLLTCQSNRFRDASTNNFAITATGSPSVQRFNPFGTSTAYSTSVIGGSGYFDGSGDYLTVPDDGAFTLSTSNYTMEMWVYPTSFSAEVAPFAYGWSSAGGNRLIVFLQQTNGTYVIYFNDASNSFTTTNTVNFNAWNHLALVRNGSNFTFYINGVSSASTTNSSSYLDSPFPIVIGGSWTGSTGGFFYPGYISNVRVVVGTAVYTSGFTPPTAPLTAVTNTQLLLNTTNGAIFDNAMMNNLETVGNAQISTSVKKYGTGSMSFDGTGDYLIGQVSPNLSFGTGNFTIEGWGYVTSIDGTYRCIMSIGWPVQIYATSGTIEVYFNDSDNNATYIVYEMTGPASSVSANTWFHFAVVRNGTTFTAYVNGVAGTPTSGVSAEVALSVTPFTLGFFTATSSYPFTGYIDDLRITKGFARYTANFTPPTAAFPNIGPV
jgi:hypothetical protein